VRIDLGAGGVVAGTVAGVHGATLMSATYATVGARHRLDAWVRLLALTAAHPDQSFDAVTIGRAGKRVGTARLRPSSAAAAVEQLTILVDLFRRGMREPLPLFTRTSELLARRPAAAVNEWETSDSFAKEDREPEHRLVLGGVVPFAALLEEPPRPDEDGPGWDAAATSRAARYAHRLWDGLLAAEERSWTW
jgi:exodeoxyribonuclease V gamma subunit